MNGTTCHQGRYADAIAPPARNPAPPPRSTLANRKIGNERSAERNSGIEKFVMGAVSVQKYGSTGIALVARRRAPLDSFARSQSQRAPSRTMRAALSRGVTASPPDQVRGRPFVTHRTVGTCRLFDAPQGEADCLPPSR